MKRAWVALLLAGCVHRYTSVSQPLELARPAPPLSVSRCTEAPERPELKGLPLPTASGELAVADVRGDDRLNFGGAYAAAWTADSAHLLILTRDGLTRWNPETGALERRIVLDEHLLNPYSVAGSPDGKWFGVSGVVVLEGGREVPTTWLIATAGTAPPRRFEGFSGLLRFTPDSTRMLGGIHVWDLPAGTEGTLPAATTDARLLPGGRGAVDLPNARYLPTREQPDPTKTYTSLPMPVLPDAVVSGDGRRVATLGKTLDVYAADTFKKLATIPNTDGASLVQLSWDGHLAVTETLFCTTLLSGGGDRDASGCPPPSLSIVREDFARALRVDDGVELWSLARKGQGQASFAIFPTRGQLLVQGHGLPEVHRFDAISGVELAPGSAPRVGAKPNGEPWAARDPEGANVSRMFRPLLLSDRRTLVTPESLDHQSQLGVWDLEQPSRTRDLPVRVHADQLAPSGDEKLVALASYDGELELVSLDGEQRPLEQRHHGQLLSMVFSPDSRRLATSGDDGQILLFDVATGRAVGSATLPLDRAPFLWWSPDGHELWADTERGMRVRLSVRE